MLQQANIGGSMRKRYWVVLGFIGAVTGLWAWNSSLIACPSSNWILEFIAHRGLHQTFHREGLTNQTCTAERIFPPSHDYLENTPESTNAAIELGADIVEIDIAPTMDNKLAVFHDWTLDCRTTGTGPIRDKKMADLRYGYTADEGKTVPFRGKFVGQLYELSEFIERVQPSDAKLLINFKSDDPEEAKLLLDYFENDPKLNQMTVAVYGGARPVAETIAKRPDLGGYSKQDTKACLLKYIALGWSGHVPEECHNKWVSVPANIAPAMWGWPHRLTKRLAEHNSRLVLLGPMDLTDIKSGTTGIDQLEQLDYIPENFDGYIWTNRLEVLKPALDAR